jgi:hypothetical protein
MHFETRSTWEVKDPIYKVFDNPENPCFRWRAVEIPLAVYCYHVNVVPSETDLELGASRTNVLMGDIMDVLNALRDYPDSTVSLQTPPWLNNGEPGLYRVTAIYKSEDPVNKPFIAKCADGKMRVLALDSGSESINPETVEKTTLWSTIK